MAPPIDYQINIVSSSDSTTVVSTRRKQIVSPAANKQSCPRRQLRCNRVADSAIAVFVQFPVMSAWQQTMPRSIPGLAQLLRKTEADAVWKAWAWLRPQSKKTQSGMGEGVRLAYIRQWKECHVCCSCRGPWYEWNSPLSLMFIVEWRLNRVEPTCNDVLPFVR